MNKVKAVRSGPEQTETALLREISTKLDRLIGVMAAQGKDRDKQIDILMAAGCDSAFIGTIVGMQPGAVRTLLSRRRARTPTSNSPAESE
jgi:hypothetical protein